MGLKIDLFTYINWHVVEAFSYSQQPDGVAV
jgi:hypothetical protein